MPFILFAILKKNKIKNQISKIQKKKKKKKKERKKTGIDQ
jgi:hypothetical protein